MIVNGKEIIPCKPVVFTPENVDSFGF